MARTTSKACLSGLVLACVLSSVLNFGASDTTFLLVFIRMNFDRSGTNLFKTGLVEENGVIKILEDIMELNLKIYRHYVSACKGLAWKLLTLN